MLKGEQKKCIDLKIQIARLVLIVENVTDTVRTAKKSIFKKYKKDSCAMHNLGGMC